MDEQLRILNERSIENRELRDLIIKIRDESYDAINPKPQQNQEQDFSGNDDESEKIIGL